MWVVLTTEIHMNIYLICSSCKLYFVNLLCLSKNELPCAKPCKTKRERETVNSLDFSEERGKQIYFSIWDKYIFKFETNTFLNLRQIHFSIGDKTICKFETNKFSIWDKYSLQFETNTFWKGYWHLLLNCINCCSEGWPFVFSVCLDKYIWQFGQIQFKMWDKYI